MLRSRVERKCTHEPKKKAKWQSNLKWKVKSENKKFGIKVGFLGAWVHLGCIFKPISEVDKYI